MGAAAPDLAVSEVLAFQEDTFDLEGTMLRRRREREGDCKQVVLGRENGDTAQVLHPLT
jgi:hypothetical protein